MIALGIDRKIAEMIYMFRVGEDGIPGTEDDNVFMDTSKVIPRLSRFYGLSDSQVRNLSVVLDRFLDAKSQNFTIKSVAFFEGSKVRSEVECITDYAGKVLYWHES
jgi:hypothetical protein